VGSVLGEFESEYEAGYCHEAATHAKQAAGEPGHDTD
jgi:hypothetical protein